MVLDELVPFVTENYISKGIFEVGCIFNSIKEH